MTPAALGLAQGALSIFGGLLGRNQRTPGVDYKRLVRDAKAAGFNPLTALMAGGAASYTPQYQPPALSSAGFIAEGLARATDTWYNAKVQRDTQADEIRLQEAANAAYQTALSAQAPGGYGFSMTVPGPNVQTGGPPLTYSSSDEASAVPQLPLSFMGNQLRPVSGTSDTEAWETRYGEIAAEGVGVAALGYDLASAGWDSLMAPGRAAKAAGLSVRASASGGGHPRVSVPVGKPRLHSPMSSNAPFQNPFLWGF